MKALGVASTARGRERRVVETFERRLALEDEVISARAASYIALRTRVMLAAARIQAGRARIDWPAAVAVSLRRGDTMIDCGANVGLTTVAAALRVGSRGRVLAIEPSPTAIAVLEQRKKVHCLRHVALLRAAAGAAPGRALLHEYEDYRGGASSLRPALDRQADRMTEAEVVSLDEAAASNLSGPVRLVKLDIEGAELNALRGACTLIARDKPDLCIELFEGQLAKFGATVDDITGLLREWEYHIIHRPVDIEGWKLLDKADTIVGHQNVIAFHDSSERARLWKGFVS